MKEIILCKLGEIVLKGLNRRTFEQKLLSNLRHALYGVGSYRVSCSQSTVYIEGADENADMDAAFEAARKVFGVIKLSRAAACEKDKDAITALAKDYLRGELLRAKSFKVETKRSDKRFPMTSIELSQYVGGELAEACPNCAVDVHNPELTVNREIRDLAAYVHAAPVTPMAAMVWLATWPRFSPVTSAPQPLSRAMRSAMRIMNRRMMMVKYSSGHLSRISSWMWVKGTTQSRIRPHQAVSCCASATTFSFAASPV